MKKVILGMAIIAIHGNLEVFAKAQEISEVQQKNLETVDNQSYSHNVFPNFSQRKVTLNMKGKSEYRKLLLKMKERIKELQNQVAELLGINSALQEEKSSLTGQLQELRNTCTDRDKEVDRLNIKVLNLEREVEELLQKLFDYQMNAQEIKTVSFELNLLLNQIPAEDEITKDCVKLLQNLTDINKRIDKTLKDAESIEPDFEKADQIESDIKEMNAIQNLVQQKIDFYHKHEEKLMTLCNKDKEILPIQLKQLKSNLLEEQKKYPEIAKLNLEENFMNSIKLVKSFRQTKPEEQASELKLLEKSLYDYIKLKVKESDLQRLDSKTRDFSDNIAKIKMMSEELLDKKDELNTLRDRIISKIEDKEGIQDQVGESIR